MAIRREPEHGQLLPPAGRALRLRTEGAESGRVLERGTAAAGDRRPALAAADVVRLSRLCARHSRGHGLRQPALSAPEAAEDGTGAGAHETQKGGGAHQHEDQLLHEHLPRTADSPVADLRPGQHAAGSDRQELDAGADRPDQLQCPETARSGRSDARAEPHRKRHAAPLGLPAGHSAPRPAAMPARKRSRSIWISLRNGSSSPWTSTSSARFCRTWSPTP